MEAVENQEKEAEGEDRAEGRLFSEDGEDGGDSSKGRRKRGKNVDGNAQAVAGIFTLVFRC